MPPKRRFDPLLIATKTAFLQRIQECVVAGYTRYTTGTISLEKAPRLFQKFEDLYAVSLRKDERYRRKKTGLASATLHARLSEEFEIDFVLMFTPGETIATSLERLYDVHLNPIPYRELELVRLTKRGKDHPVFTWRMNTATVEAWRQRLHLHTAHNNENEILRDWFSLYRTIGFAGIRRQVGELVAYWRREWKQLRGDAPCPVSYPHNEPKIRPLHGMARGDDGKWRPSKGFPNSHQLPTLFYVRKKSSDGERLSKVMREVLPLLNGTSDSDGDAGT